MCGCMHPRFASTGLGLQICSEGIQGHGGGVWLSGKALSTGEILSLSSGILACCFSSPGIGLPWVWIGPGGGE